MFVINSDVVRLVLIALLKLFLWLEYCREVPDWHSFEIHTLCRSYQAAAGRVSKWHALSSSASSVLMRGTCWLFHACHRWWTVSSVLNFVLGFMMWVSGVSGNQVNLFPPSVLGQNSYCWAGLASKRERGLVLPFLWAGILWTNWTYSGGLGS